MQDHIDHRDACRSALLIGFQDSAGVVTAQNSFLLSGQIGTRRFKKSYRATFFGVSTVVVRSENDLGVVSDCFGISLDDFNAWVDFAPFHAMNSS